MKAHGGLRPNDNAIHQPHAYEFANAAARLAMTGFVADDVYKLAIDTDTKAIWRLDNHSPIAWTRFGQGGTRVAYLDVSIGGTTHADPYLVTFDPDALDTKVVSATAIGVAGAVVKLPTPTAAMYGRIIYIWNLATSGILTVENETGTTINTISPPAGGAAYQCVNAGGYQWRKITDTTSGAYTDEQAQDAVEAMLNDGGDISKQYNDPANSLQLWIKPNAVTFSKMQTMAAGKLIGTNGASSGNPEAINVGSGLLLSGNTLSASGSPAFNIPITNLGTVTTAQVLTIDGHKGWELVAGANASISFALSGLTATNEYFWSIRITQDATGGRSLTFTGTNIDNPGAIMVIPIATGANRKTTVRGWVHNGRVEGILVLIDQRNA